MTKKTKKGYLWIFDQQDKWDDIVSDKINQLEDIKAVHLDWFNRHSTASELLALRRPDLKRKHESISATTAPGQIVPDTKVFNVTETMSNTSEPQSVDMDETAEIQTINIDEPAQQAFEPVKDRIEMENVKDQTEELNDPPENEPNDKAYATENQVEDDAEKIDSVKTSPITQEPATTHTIPQITSTSTQNITQSTQPEKHTTHPFSEDYDEQDDEIQVVVPARKQKQEPKETSPIETPSVNDLLHLSSSTSSKPFSLSHVKSSIPTSSSSSSTNTLIAATAATRHRSEFMNRLFKTSRPSLKKAALPTPSASSSTTRNNSHSNHPVIITKRPSSTASIRSVSSYKSSVPIQACDIMPEPRFKRPQTLQRLDFGPSQTHALSLVEEVDEPSQSQRQSQDQDQMTNQSQKLEEDQAEDGPFKTPEWAEDNLALEAQLKKQSCLDPDKVFGRLPPLDLRGMCDIFPHFI